MNLRRTIETKLGCLRYGHHWETVLVPVVGQDYYCQYEDGEFTFGVRTQGTAITAERRRCVRCGKVTE